MPDTFFDLPETEQRRIIERAANRAGAMQRRILARFDRQQRAKKTFWWHRALLLVAHFLGYIAGRAH